MTETSMALVELLEKADDGDFLRAVAEAVLQLLMEADVEGVIGAGRHERSPERLNYRNGHRARTLDTRLGPLQLRIPKLRQGSHFPPFLEPRKTSERALVAVIQEAWIGGVSTRRVDDLVQAMGLTGISKSQVSKLCKDIDERVGAFLDRPLEGEWPYLWLDATYLRQREGGRIVTVAVIRDKSARIALRWALRDLSLAARAGRRWLHYLRDNPVMLRRVIDRALEARLLQRDAGRSDRHDLVVLAEGVGRAYQLLTGKPLGRSLTAEQRPTGPGVRLVRLCLEPPNQPGLEPPGQPVTDDAIVWAIRRVQAHPW